MIECDKCAMVATGYDARRHWCDSHKPETSTAPETVELFVVQYCVSEKDNAWATEDGFCWDEHEAGAKIAEMNARQDWYGEEKPTTRIVRIKGEVVE